MKGSVRPHRVLAALGLLTTIAAAAATVALSSPTTTVGARTPQTGTVAAGRSAGARPALSVTPAPQPPAIPVAGTADPSALFVLYATSAQGAGPAHVVRLSRLGQVVATGGGLPAGSDLVRAGDSLWVAAGATAAVYRLDPTRLLLRGRVDLPVPARAITATATAVWVGGPGRLARIDPRTGAPAAPVPVDGEVTSLSADPTGRLYAAATTPQGAVISERDARTGAVVASRRLGPGAAHLAAVAGGVWVWQEGPAPPAMVRLRPGDLHPAAAVTPAPGAAWLRGAVAGSLLWVADPTTLTCADPLTGRMRAAWASPPTQQVLAADRARVALLAAGRVVVFPTDPHCG